MFAPGDIVHIVSEWGAMWKERGLKHTLVPMNRNMLVLKSYPVYDDNGDSPMYELEVMFDDDIWTTSSQYVIKSGDESCSG